MSAREKNQYWIPNLDINKKVITQEIQFYLGPDSTVRPYTYEGEDGFLITTPGECLTDEQIDDICCKSREVWERKAAARTRIESEKQLKRPLHRPVLVSRAVKNTDTRSRRRYSDERPEGQMRLRSDERRYDGGGRY